MDGIPGVLKEVTEGFCVGFRWEFERGVRGRSKRFDEPQGVLRGFQGAFKVLSRRFKRFRRDS